MPEPNVMARATPGPSGYLRDTAVGVRRAEARLRDGGQIQRRRRFSQDGQILRREGVAQRTANLGWPNPKCRVACSLAYE